MQFRLAPYCFCIIARRTIRRDSSPHHKATNTYTQSMLMPSPSTRRQVSWSCTLQFYRGYMFVRRTRCLQAKQPTWSAAHKTTNQDKGRPLPLSSSQCISYPAAANLTAVPDLSGEDSPDHMPAPSNWKPCSCIINRPLPICRTNQWSAHRLSRPSPLSPVPRTCDQGGTAYSTYTPACMPPILTSQAGAGSSDGGGAVIAPNPLHRTQERRPRQRHGGERK